MDRVGNRIHMSSHHYEEIEASEAEIMGRVKELIGDDSIEIKLKNKSIWRNNGCYSKEYSKGNVHCPGHAVHPPSLRNGIQDAFNFAGKLAYVLKGRADPSLLSTHNEERQPMGKYIVGRAKRHRT